MEMNKRDKRSLGLLKLLKTMTVQIKIRKGSIKDGIKEKNDQNHRCGPTVNVRTANIKNATDNTLIAFFTIFCFPMVIIAVKTIGS